MPIPQELFLSLTRDNPRIAHRLIESMACRIDLPSKKAARLHSR